MPVFNSVKYVTVHSSRIRRIGRIGVYVVFMAAQF